MVCVVADSFICHLGGEKQNLRFSQLVMELLYLRPITASHY